MAKRFSIFLLLVALGSSAKGQKYFLGQPDYYSNQDELTDPSLPFYPRNYYVTKDLQTSELPVNLQETLPQYQQQHITSQHDFQANRPAPFQSPKEYVKPSTHRPDYSHLLSQRYHREPLKTLSSYEQRNAPGNQFELPSSNFQEINGNAFETERTRHPKNLLTATSKLNTGNINPVDSFNKDNNKLDSHFNKRDNTEEATREKLDGEKYLEPMDEADSNSEAENDTLTEDSDESSNEEENNELNDTENEEEFEYYDEEIEDDEDNSEIGEDERSKNDTYEVLTMKPMTRPSQDNMFDDFVDVESMDTTTQEPATSIILTQSPVRLSTNNENEGTKDTKEFPELVVSVVTSKTIENNTIISPFPFTPSNVSTESTLGVSVENSTDSWIVIASVQTSRSISGTRYIPSSVVDQDERRQLLNEPNLSTTQSSTVNNTSDMSETEPMPAISSTIAKTKTSTESLIDKLDRVQSDLSSGLLTGGYKNDNIAVIEESLSTKVETTTEEIPTTELPTIKSTTPKDPYPLVNIRKFNAGNRPFRPKVKGTVPKRKEIPHTTTKPDQETYLQKDTLQSILQKAKPVQDISVLLPPGYKPPVAIDTGIDDNSDTAVLLEIAKPVDDISALLPPGYKLPQSSSTEKPDSVSSITKSVDDISAFLPAGYKPHQSEKPTSDILSIAKPVDDISALLPPGYKPPKSVTTEKTNNILSKVKPVDDISALLPPGYKSPKSVTTEKTNNILSKVKPVDDISALLPPGYKSPKSVTTEKTNNILSKVKPVDDISALLPPGYKPPKSVTTEKTNNILSKVKPVDDISALLPPGYKPPKSGTTEKTPVDNILSALLPPGYKIPTSSSTEKSSNSLLSNAKPVDDISALLPPGYRKGFSKPSSKPKETVKKNLPSNHLTPGLNSNDTSKEDNIETSTSSSISTSIPATTSGKAIKLVFPSRPGGGARKTPRLTTPRLQNEEMNKPTSPSIQKGWPVRASTEFTGWPTPSTTPISIEKLLEAARKAHTSTTTAIPTEPPSTTTTTTTTTTTPKPTTPGICVDDCDLAGTIKLVGGAKWVPELLDPNTKEYQILSNSVQTELENIYNSSPVLNKWYEKVRIDGFSEGSVLVDFLVEFNEIGHKVDTQEIKRLFHESLTNGATNREGKSFNETKAEKFTLGRFEVDPKYTDFIVIPKNPYPTVGYADEVLLPQWAIAVIVIGLASLLFVIIFGVTVLVNRHKNSKKAPAPLTEDMLNELNKNHMGGLENYAPDDFYNMEDVWSDKHYEQKPQKKRTSGSGGYDHSTSNLYDSWQSQWNGQWNNGYSPYGNPNSSQYSGHSGHRRPDYDTNF